jgi:hypothetical protein
MSDDCAQVSGAGPRLPVDADAESRQRISEEHHALRDLLGRVTETSDVHHLLPQLQELDRLLREHFQHEEGEGGFHDMVGESAPHLLPSVQRLFDEHRRIAERLDALILQTRRCIEGPVAEVCAEAADLARLLHEHEAAENDLVAWALYEDLGFSS